MCNKVLRKSKSRLSRIYRGLFAGNKIFTITILTIGLIASINAQGITMTLGGNTADDKFIVENSDAEAGLVVTGEGNVGIGTTNPLSKLSVGGDGTSTATIYGETAVGANGAGVIGLATNTGAVTNYGGNFSAEGEYGNGVYGEA